MKQLLIRNTYSGCIWQVYNIKEDYERTILERNARGNGFLSFQIVDTIEDDYEYPETWPDWREHEGWSKCVEEYKATITS